MKKLYLPFLFILFLFSCERSKTLYPEDIGNERLVFLSQSEFYNTYIDVAKMDYDDQTQWVNDRNLSSPLIRAIDYCNDTIMQDMPRALQALFNTNLEIQINDSLIVFDNGNLYVKEIKQKALSEPIICGGFKLVPLSQEPVTRALHTVPFNGVGSTYQIILNTGLNDGHRFKYVHELVGVQYFRGNFCYIDLFLVLKLEYKRNRWKIASQKRDIDVNLNIYTRSLRGVQYNQNILLKHFQCGSIIGHEYVFNITGTITHTVVGYPASKEVNKWSYNDINDPWDGWTHGSI